MQKLKTVIVGLFSKLSISEMVFAIFVMGYLSLHVMASYSSIVRENRDKRFRLECSARCIPAGYEVIISGKEKECWCYQAEGELVLESK